MVVNIDDFYMIKCLDLDIQINKIMHDVKFM